MNPQAFEFCSKIELNCLQSHHDGRARSKFHMFYNMYSIANMSRKVLGIRVNVNTCEIPMNG